MIEWQATKVYEIKNAFIERIIYITLIPLFRISDIV